MTLFVNSPFISHAGRLLDFKVDCDALTDADLKTLAGLIAGRINFSAVVGIPRGGLRLAAALKPYRSERLDQVLVVDDVLTTGTSMAEERAKYWRRRNMGVVIFARGPLPPGVCAVFTLAEQFR